MPSRSNSELTNTYNKRDQIRIANKMERNPANEQGGSSPQKDVPEAPPENQQRANRNPDQIEEEKKESS